MSQIIDVLIPIQSERYLPQIVMDSLLIQNYPMRFFFSNVIGNSAIQARESVLQMWKKCEPHPEFVLMTDNDIIFYEKTLDLMLEFLDNNKDFGGIGLQRGAAPNELIEQEHISAGPVLYRSEDYKQISYIEGHKDQVIPAENPEDPPTVISAGCDCIRQSNNIRWLGKRIGYLPNLSYKHIKNTNRSVS